MCGRRKIERDYPNLVNWGDMPYEMVESLSHQLPENIVIQFHDNGEPLLYGKLSEALSLFSTNIRCMDTNGRLLLDRQREIVDNLETITISTFTGDTESDDQFQIIKGFLKIKGDKKPNVIIRCLGNDPTPYKSMGCLIATRTIHSPMGSFDYEKQRIVPEIGICLDALSHLVIKRTGDVSMCVRFDPEGIGVIGNVSRQNLEDIWNGDERQRRLKLHIEGKRKEIPLCSKCDYWGVPG